MDASTRAPVYVGKLTREMTGLACGCICPACDARLQAVNAGASGDSRRVPFFRHHNMQQGPACKYRVAELAALQLLADKGMIEIPAPRKSSVFAGASGTLYPATAVGVAVRELIVARRLVSETHAILTLASGREVALVLRGHQNVGELGSVFAVIQIQVDDPEVAWLSPEEIIARSELSTDWLHVVKHHRDEALQIEADELARQRAIEQLDIDPADLNLPIGATKKQASESLIHWAVKEALMGVGSLRTPELRRNVSAVGRHGHVHTVSVVLPAATLTLSKVEDEVLFDGYRADIVCLVQEAWPATGLPAPFRLLVEVAVTNRVKAHKLGLLQAAGMACIELDVGRFAQGGQVTRTQLRDLVASDVASKEWLHHPGAAALIERAQRQADAAMEQADAVIDAQEAQREAERQLQLAAEARAQRRLDWAGGLSRADAFRELKAVLIQRWAHKQTETTSNGMTWLAGEFERAAGRVLVMTGVEGRLFDPGGVAWRLMAIVESGRSFDRPLDAQDILGVGSGHLPPDQKTWLGLLHLAIDACNAPVHEHVDEYQAQRRTVLASLNAGEKTYARRGHVDDLLAGLFPELRDLLASQVGTMARSEQLRQARQAAEQLAEDERLEAARSAAEESARKAAAEEEERERNRLPEAVKAVTYQWGWRLDMSKPPSQDAAVDYLKLTRFKNPEASHVDLVRQGYMARLEGRDFSEWFAALSFASADDVQVAREVLESAWVVQSRLSMKPKH